jgi:hypothetical protein
MAILAIVVIYFTLIERWLFLRLSPAIAVKQIYQKFYTAGRPIAGAWTRSETSFEYLRKFTDRVNILGYQPGSVKMHKRLKDDALLLTEIYHLTLFVDHHPSNKDALNAWNTWIHFRNYIYIARLIFFIRGKAIGTLQRYIGHLKD